MWINGFIQVLLLKKCKRFSGIFLIIFLSRSRHITPERAEKWEPGKLIERINTRRSRKMEAGLVNRGLLTLECAKKWELG